MNLERKLELLNTLAGTGRGFPANSVYRDGEYALATSGWQLLAFRVADGEFDGLLTLDEGAKRFAELANREATAPELTRRWLSQEAETRTVSAQSLRDFLRVEKYLRCPYCAGSGVRPVDEPDLEDGELDDEFNAPRFISVGGATFNAVMLVSVLAYLPMGEAVSLATWAEPSKGQDDGMILRLTGDGWTLIQMSTRQLVGEGSEVFPLESAAIAEAA